MLFWLKTSRVEAIWFTFHNLFCLLEFQCDTRAFNKSNGELVCLIQLSLPMSFEQATFQCQNIGAKLPEILTNTDQQALANRKVSFNLKQVQPKDTIYVIVLNSLKKILIMFWNI